MCRNVVALAEHVVVMISVLTGTSLAAKDSIKKQWKTGYGGRMSKYRKVLEESVNVASTIRGFRTIHHSVATYEQTKKRLSNFYPKRTTEEDGIHTKPFRLLI